MLRLCWRKVGIETRNYEEVQKHKKGRIENKFGETKTDTVQEPNRHEDAYLLLFQYVTEITDTFNKSEKKSLQPQKVAIKGLEHMKHKNSLLKRQRK